MSQNHTNHTNEEAADASTLSLTDRVERWGHGSEDFAFGLEHGATPFQLEIMAVYKFPDRLEKGGVDPHGAGPFAWIPIVRKHGWVPSRIKEFLLGVLANEDPDTSFPEMMYELIRPRAQPAWELLEPNELTRLIERRIENLAYGVLDSWRTIAYAFAVTRKVKVEIPRGLSEIEGARHAEAEMVKAGEADAIILVGAAVPHIRSIFNNEALTAVLKLGLPTQLRLLLQCISYEGERCPIGSRYAAKLAIHLALSGGLRGSDGERIKHALIDTIGWQKMDYVPPKRPEYSFRGRDRGRWAEATYVPAKDADPDHAVKVYRWFLQFMQEEPLWTAEWMKGGVGSPASVRETNILVLDREFREALEKLGWRFARVVREEIPQTGESRLVAKVEKGPYTYVFVHDIRGSRHEMIQDGMEVMVPKPFEWTPLFRRGEVTGYRYELHPVAPPTMKMVEAIKSFGY